MTESDLSSVASTQAEWKVGILATLIVMVIAATIIALFELQFFVDWVAPAFMAATPAQVILGLLWHNSRPDFIGRLAQPWKGFAFTALTIVVGGAIFVVALYTVGGGHGSTPMLVQYLIMTIVVALFVVAIWQCWPFTSISKNPTVVGLTALIAIYAIAYILWQLFFDYAMLEKMQHPHYYSDIDPKGWFDMWTAVVFAVTAVGLAIVHMLFDFWPIDKLSRGASQPVRGLIASIYLFTFAYGICWIFVDVIGMQAVDYMIRVPVSMIFGTFIVNNMMQFSLLQNLPQPKRGLCLTVLAIVVAIFMHELYAMASTWHAGFELAVGPQGGFQREFWIASAMLGVTFPVVFMVSGFFAFWPLAQKS